MNFSFPFTFSFLLPGLTNPFSSTHAQPALQASRNLVEPASQPGIENAESSMAVDEGVRLASSPAPSFTSVPRPKGLKRGWEPAFAESSQSTTLVSTSGYLNPPSKHTESEYTDQELPPSKRRRGLTGSIVSTAVNAALIGTAVGLTVFRLWRGRDKQAQAIEAAPTSPDSESQQLPPPPPYQEREWTQVSYPSPPAEFIRHPLLPSPTPRRKVVRHNVRRPRKARISRPQALASPGRTDAAGSSTHVQSEFNFGREEEGADDQMDWIQDKLSQLIEEGKRALSREVVVLSDAKEDEVDDGSGLWEEEDDYHLSTSFGQTGSLKRKAKRSRNRLYQASNSSSHSLPGSSTIQPQTPRRTHTKGFSVDSVTRYITKEDENAWESPELRETMQRARQRILDARGRS